MFCPSAFVLVAMVLTLLAGSPMVAQTRRALVIGLGQQMDKSWGKINGDRDIALVTTMLRAAEYADVTTLRNEQATKAAIVAAMRGLASRAHRGDIIYIHFSGHGQQMTDTDHDERDDRYDEAWIPYDAYLRYGPHDRGERHLSDDEINVLLAAIRRSIGAKGRILVVADACHSGDSARGPEDDAPVRGVRDRFVIPDTPARKPRAKSHQWLLLSACKSYQLNAEMRNPVAGKLTYALVKASEQPSLRTNEAFMHFIADFMERYSGVLPQTPNLEGRDKFNIIDVIR